MKYLIAGLGNPGEEYENTRHNIGFMVLDALAKASNAFFKPGRHVLFTEVGIKGRQLLLIKPMTFMNLSGKAVNYWLQQEKIPLSRLLVITDDLALPFGKLRLKTTGSPGGHNGLGSITESLASPDFPRLRFGIGSEFPKGGQVHYVLSPFGQEESALLPERITLAAEAVKSFVSQGPELTMTQFNK